MTGWFHRLLGEEKHNHSDGSKRGLHGMTRLLVQLTFHCALAFLVLGANPFRGETITPFDLLVSQHAWSWVDPGVEPLTTQRADVLNAVLPQWINAREQVHEGHFPLWNPTVAGGIPHLTPSYTTLTPGYFVFLTAPDPGAGFLFATVFNLAIAGLGMFLFLRRRLGWLAATTGAVSFQFCGFNAAWLYWPHVFTLIWIPWLLLAIDYCAARRSTAGCFGIAAASALVVLGGFPFLGEIIFGAGALYVLVLLAIEKPVAPGRFVVMYVSGTVLGFVLCALPLLEFVNWMSQFDLGYRENRGSYLGMQHLLQLLPPWAYRDRNVEATMYVGAVMLACAIIGVAVAAARWRRPSLLPVFAVLLLLVTGGLVFDLWPMWLVGWFPGMSFNAWSRAIGVMDFALIVLGATLLDGLWRSATQHWRRIAQMLIVLLVCFQSVEMIGFFRRYNGSVPGQDFYPDVPAISYMQEHAGPFDHVVADRSFLMSGTLGAYGLSEWFGHQFRTEELQSALKAMADRPFFSRTASRLRREDLRLDSPAMALFNVRYVAISSEDPGTRDDLKRSNRAHVLRKPLPPMPEHQPRQTIEVDKATVLDGISVRMATYCRRDLQGTVRLSLAGTAGTGAVVSEVDAATIVDNRMVEFYFPEPQRLAPGKYIISLEYRPAPGSGNLTAWSLADTDDQLLAVDGLPHEGRIDLMFHAHRDGSAAFRRVFTAAGISILENQNSPNGAYFLPVLDQVPGPHSSRPVRLDTWRSDRFRLSYLGTDAGYVIVPMKLAPGWHAAVDGKPVSPQLLAGLMPAVAVDGPAAITFRYRPWWLRWWPAWLATTVLLGALLAWRFRCPDRQDVGSATA